MQSAINASQSFLPANLPSPPIYSKTNPADAPVLTLAITSKTMPLSQVEDLVDTRLAPKISQLERSRTGEHQRRAKAGSSHSGESIRTVVVWNQSRRFANGCDAIQRERREGQLRRSATKLSDRRERSAGHQQGLQKRSRRVPEWRAGDADGRRERLWMAWKTSIKRRGWTRRLL